MTEKIRRYPTIRLTDDGNPTRIVPLGNDRMFQVEVHNRGRITKGTMSTHRWAALIIAAKARYPKLTKTPFGIEPLVLRRERGGKVVAILNLLEGPVASRATKH